jgi:hypothetical protein
VQLADSKPDKLDAAVDFLWRINYDPWMPEDAQRVRRLIKFRGWSKPSVFLLDTFHCDYLVRRTYPSRGRSLLLGIKRTGIFEWRDTLENNEESVMAPPYGPPSQYTDNCYGIWLQDCEQFIWETMIRVYDSDQKSWAKVTMGDRANVLVFVDLLVNLVSFVDRRFSSTPRKAHESRKLRLSDLILELLEDFSPMCKQYSGSEDLAGQLRTISGNPEIFELYIEWAITGIKKIAGVDFSVSSPGWRTFRTLAGPEYTRLNQPCEVPDWTALGLITEIGRTGTSFDITMAEIDASFIHSGPFKVEITRKINEHLSFDKVKGRVLVYSDGCMYPGASAGIFKEISCRSKASYLIINNCADCSDMICCSTS